MEATHVSSLADYQVGATIAQGALGSVWLARHAASHQWVAIKVVSKLLLTKKSHLLKGVVREQKILSKLLPPHPHIVSLRASFHDAHHLYLVLHLCTRGTLTQATETRRTQQTQPHQQKEQDTVWKQKVVPSYVLQIVQGLECLHSHRVVHGDLKPDNILVDETGRLQLTDFGSSLILKEETPPEPPMNMTTDYASPEVVLLDSRTQANVVSSHDEAKDRPRWFAVDLWSLGCLCFALLEKGKSPFAAESDARAVQTIHDYVKGTYALPHVLPEAWNSLVAGLLEVDPWKRIGMSDHDLQSKESSLVVYRSIRSHVALQEATADDDDVNSSDTYLPPHPAWWKDPTTASLRDGKLGWKLFLGLV